LYIFRSKRRELEQHQANIEYYNIKIDNKLSDIRKKKRPNSEILEDLKEEKSFIMYLQKKLEERNDPVYETEDERARGETKQKKQKL